MIEDTELLRRYAEENSEVAFTELVHRRIGLVYAVALRRAGGDVHRAQEATQKVFVDLARKAGALCRRPVLGGWLYRSAQFAASDVMRANHRWHAREQEAHFMDEIERPAPEPDWERLRPVLDELLAEMDERDRDAILLRFFDARPFAEIGERLRLTDNAARMRLERALGKLRTLLERRGVTSTTAALAVALANQPILSTPAGLAATVTGAALAAGSAAGPAAAALLMSKLQLGFSGALALAGAAALVLQAQSNAGLRDEAAALRKENAALASARAENVELRRAAAEIAEFRHDDAQFSRLNDEALALRRRLKAVARAEQAHAPDAVATLDQLPRPVFQPRPQYPPEWRNAGAAGKVMIDFIVDANGDVRNARAVQASLEADTAAPVGPQAVLMSEFVVTGPVTGTVTGITGVDARGRLEAAAIEAVSQWKFAAGQKRGRNVNTHMQVPVVFTLPEAEHPTTAPISGNGP